MAEGLAAEELALRLWYLVDGDLGFIEDYAIPSALEDLSAPRGFPEQPADPCRTVLNEVAALLARHDWSGLVRADKRFRGLHRRARRGLRAEGSLGPGRQPS